MTIERIDADTRWSDAVIHNDVIYYTSVPETLDGDIVVQTSDALAAIDVLLLRVGSDKSKILDATIFLADKADFSGMNQAWDAWVVAGSAPVRCTVQAGLMDPKYKVEIKIIAAR
ncbi:RidA family protein [Moellerella wisconsensis]|uniref:RidA family protein n=2 Tax=Moellerella wisconsensis TaxID=158849 RepID=A0ACD3YBV4_9GAMM|nr:RidA family protein [Moellerella wisconsensis]KLN96403.1 endoribonuclease L-PSP [Moellerella wisconsensis]KPD02871.1 putative translation initiation inhibitor [Moellerella wisconsensis ATCC 35017]UNH25521.1 RidA family protein [Moellerella wisconsensis]UNH28706.1 RidA family protein [Moellerella wisconsensis]UNH40308.1 RidA family protein [Moellerella wisconsensis]